MIRPPFMARVAAGVALTMVEEARQLPTTAVALPMTSVSFLLQSTMRVQQTMTSLAIKGDEAFSFLYPSSEQPTWAVFDEDELTVAESDGSPAQSPPPADGTGSLGRFALYSTPNAVMRGRDRTAQVAPGDDDTATPEVAVAIGYDDLTLAQLRPRLHSLSADELYALLDYERAGDGRPPFLTMLENRLATVAPK